MPTSVFAPHILSGTLKTSGRQVSHHAFRINQWRLTNVSSQCFQSFRSTTLQLELCLKSSIFRYFPARNSRLDFKYVFNLSNVYWTFAPPFSEMWGHARWARLASQHPKPPQEARPLFYYWWHWLKFNKTKSLQPRLWLVRWAKWESHHYRPHQNRWLLCNTSHEHYMDSRQVYDCSLIAVLRIVNIALYRLN